MTSTYRPLTNYKEGEYMRFMLFVCAEPDLQLSPEDKAALPGEVEEWATDLANRGIRLLGHVFEPVGQANTIRRRNDDLQITDGPVNSADEPIADFNLLECGTLEEAVEVSAMHRWRSTGRLSYERSPRRSTPRSSGGPAFRNVP
jgi:hypothetical protein